MTAFLAAGCGKAKADPSDTKEANNTYTPTRAGALQFGDFNSEGSDAADIQPEEAPMLNESTEEDVTGIEAIYLGVENYGSPEVNKDTKESFRYRFEIDGSEQVYGIDSGPADADGEPTYPIQNLLVEGEAFRIETDGDRITDVSPVSESAPSSYTPAVSGVPGERTLTNLLRTAFMPVGTALYIYGGGWDWQDKGSSLQSRTLGVSGDWVRFFNAQDASYTYKDSDPAKSYYPFGGYNEYYYAGLDCSGYLGWVIYNTLEKEDLRNGYVVASTGFGKRLADLGLGTRTQDIKAPSPDNGYSLKPGDIMSINGHVFLSLGTCSDGSVLILHSSPSKSRAGSPGGGVQLSAIGWSESCEAFALADRIMSSWYPQWYERYPVLLANPDTYFSFSGDSAGLFSWNIGGAGLSDPDGLLSKTPAEVLDVVFR
ncbi:MAG: hypothetical protein IJT05_00950 [Lachnospiraceae bacterium]|nr:hypothetical protein [Lachnospiraceae bacterium]